MKSISIRYIFNFLSMLAVSASLSSCSFVDEHNPDCTPLYKLKFRFDKNMLYADAFPTQVSEVDVYVFDKEGKLVWHGSEEGEPLAQEGYLMDLPLRPGSYDIVAWCGKEHENAHGFTMAEQQNPLEPAHLRMKMHREYAGSVAHSSRDLHALFHGKLTSVSLPEEYGEHIYTMPLTKDTNVIRVQLVHLSGKEISKDDFDFTITDSNGHLDHDNTILDDETVEYRAWNKKNGMATSAPPVVDNLPSAPVTPLSESGSTRVVDGVHSVVAELSTSRLQTCQNPILTVTRKEDGEKVISIPVIDYALMVKGEYHRAMSDDEFLDRQDEYPMTFFLDESGHWYKYVIDILQWRVVFQNADL